jgi:hypothetical protein
VMAVVCRDPGKRPGMVTLCKGSMVKESTTEQRTCISSRIVRKPPDDVSRPLHRGHLLHSKSTIY